MGFGYFMYSHSLVPVIDLWISGRDKVGIRALIAIVELWCIVLCSIFTTTAIRLSNIILSFLLPVFCIVSIPLWCFDFIWFVFSEREVEHEMLLLLKQLMMLNSSFRTKLLSLLLDEEGEVEVEAELGLNQELLLR